MKQKTILLSTSEKIKKMGYKKTEEYDKELTEKMSGFYEKILSFLRKKIYQLLRTCVCS